MTAAESGPTKVWATRRLRPWGHEDLIMNDRVGTSCWGWTLWALAFFGIAIAFIYLLGGFDITPAIAH
jgi:hypothetical protein